MKLNLENKNVLVTGSSSGIGFEIAKNFSDLGSNVFINSRNLSNLVLAKKLIGNNNVQVIKGDLTKPKQVEKLFNSINKCCNHLDVLVCNIGNSAPKNIIGEEKNENWVESLGTNLLSATNTIYHFRKLLKKSLSPSIVCISSICGVNSLGAPIDYSVSKAALISFVKNQSRILSCDNIRINSISPGNIFFDGGIWDQKIKKNKLQVKKYLKNNVPLNKFGTKKNISDMVLFLSSDISSFTTGANIIIDGGQTA